MFVIAIIDKKFHCLSSILMNSYYFCENYLACKGYEKIREDFFQKDETFAIISEPRYISEIEVLNKKDV